MTYLVFVSRASLQRKIKDRIDDVDVSLLLEANGPYGV